MFYAPREPREPLDLDNKTLEELIEIKEEMTKQIEADTQMALKHLYTQCVIMGVVYVGGGIGAMFILAGFAIGYMKGLW